jgi:transposase InsO family protein
MQIVMRDIKTLTLGDIEAFLTGSQELDFSVKSAEAYKFIEGVLSNQHYSKLTRGARGLVRRFLMKVTGLSRAQMTRLIERWRDCRQVRRKPAQRPNFPRIYTPGDIALLAEMDAAHEDLSGPAMRHLFVRAHQVHHQTNYGRLAEISVSHIYNLRRSDVYQKLRIHVRHTQARKVSIGERRLPDPKGKPGYLRVDTVHQGIHDGKAGVYHINAVDAITQFEVVGCVEAISEHFITPVLEAMLHQFPFRILGFHCDNGSEFINHSVEAMLENLLAEFTKSRAYRTTDNALVEGKNGSVIRKLIGYGPIAAANAGAFQKFYTATLNPYLNFHRPCGFASLVNGKRGRIKRVYRHDGYLTPYEKLRSLPQWGKTLKPGINAVALDRLASLQTDLAAAQDMHRALTNLLAKHRLTR